LVGNGFAGPKGLSQWPLLLGQQDACLGEEACSAAVSLALDLGSPPPKLYRAAIEPEKIAFRIATTNADWQIVPKIGRAKTFAQSIMSRISAHRRDLGHKNSLSNRGTQQGESLSGFRNSSS